MNLLKWSYKNAKRISLINPDKLLKKVKLIDEDDKGKK